MHAAYGAAGVGSATVAVERSSSTARGSSVRHLQDAGREQLIRSAGPQGLTELDGEADRTPARGGWRVWVSSVPVCLVTSESLLSAAFGSIRVS